MTKKEIEKSEEINMEEIISFTLSPKAKKIFIDLRINEHGRIKEKLKELVKVLQEDRRTDAEIKEVLLATKFCHKSTIYEYMPQEMKRPQEQSIKQQIKAELTNKPNSSSDEHESINTSEEPKPTSKPAESKQEVSGEPELETVEDRAKSEEDIEFFRQEAEKFKEVANDALKQVAELKGKLQAKPIPTTDNSDARYEKLQQLRETEKMQWKQEKNDYETKIEQLGKVVTVIKDGTEVEGVFQVSTKPDFINEHYYNNKTPIEVKNLILQFRNDNILMEVGWRITQQEKKDKK